MNGTDITMADETSTPAAPAAPEIAAPAAASAPARTPSPVPALAPGTFASTLPGVEDLLELIYGVAEGEDVANERVVEKVS